MSIVIFDPPAPGPFPGPLPEPGPLPPAAQRLYDRWAPYWDVDREQGYPLWHLAEALCSDVEELDAIARDSDTHEAWHTLFDPAVVPAFLLAWLAQFVGVRLLPSDTEAHARDRISSAAGFYRGTARAIREETARLLTGTQTVKVIKTAAWALTVVTRTSETPDAAAAEVAARRQKPAGVVMTFVTSDNPVWDEATVTWNDVAAGVTWDDVAVADVT